MSLILLAFSCAPLFSFADFSEPVGTAFTYDSNGVSVYVDGHDQVLGASFVDASGVTQDCPTNTNDFTCYNGNNADTVFATCIYAAGGDFTCTLDTTGTGGGTESQPCTTSTDCTVPGQICNGYDFCVNTDTTGVTCTTNAQCNDTAGQACVSGTCAGSNTNGTGSGSPTNGTGPGSPTNGVNSTQVINPLSKALAGNGSVCNFLSAIINIVTEFGAVLGVLLLIWAGFMFVKAQGNETALKKAKMTILYTILGLAILLGASVFTKIIINTVNSVIGNNATICAS